MIKKVKLQAEIDNPEVIMGYLVDDDLSVPLDPGNSEFQMVQQWISNGNTPHPAYTPQELYDHNKEKEKEKIKDEMNNLLGDMTPAESMMLMLRYGMIKSSPDQSDDGGAIDDDLTPTGEDIITWGDRLASELEIKIRKLRSL